MLDFAPSPQIPRFALGKGDRVTINDTAYRPIDVTETGYVLVRLDGQGVAESFTRAELSRMVDLGRVSHERDALLPESARARLQAPSDLISTMPDEQHRRARRKEAAVLSFLQMEAAGAVNRTDASIEHAKKAIRGGACDLLETASHYDGARLEAGESRAPKFSPRTLRRWLSAYEDLGISGLFEVVPPVVV